jgi:signal transduction histidine kinase
MYVEVSFRDGRGQLWFGSHNGGLSRLTPVQDRPAHKRPVLITVVRINGRDQPINALGSPIVTLHLGPAQNHIEIEFATLSFRPGDTLLYQYKLEGVKGDWSAPREQRNVNYANLAPGSYRFLARAVLHSNTSEAALVMFTIAPPVWRRWWFIALVAAALTAMVYWVHRRRLEQAVELERVRMRIATDLHDDIGATLTQITLLSEVARRAINGDEKWTEPIARIGELSRELTESMSDLVWSINPRRDNLADLVHRMRRFANDVCNARNIDLEFETYGSERDVKLSTDARRQIYLILKESVNNIVRHSACTRANIRVCLERNLLLLTVSDNGRGITSVSGGHGLDSMRSRAARIGGELAITAEAGCGSTVTLSAPVGR